MKRILILDDNLTICLMLKSWLVKKEYQADTATSVQEAQQKVRNEAYDLILSDIRMPDVDGFSFLSWIKKFDSAILVIMMTGYADIESAVESMKLGAADYIAKPIEAELLYKKIADAFKVQENQRFTEQFRDPLIWPPGECYDAISAKVNEVIHDESHLLVIGDNGTGKTSVARYIYSRGRIDSGPFVTIDLNPQSLTRNCEKGDHEIHFMQSLERAKGGLLLIQNLQKTGITIQTMLLRALSAQKKDEDFVQIIMTTEEKKEQLESILLPKLADLILRSYIELPTLRGNREAILFFADHFLEVVNRELDKKMVTIEREVLEALFNHPWEENIKEMKYLIFKACLLAEGDRISAKVLPALFNTPVGERSESPQLQREGLEGLKKENYEKEKIIEALRIARGNKTVAASILNIDRKTLYNKIKLYSIEVN